MPLQFQRTDRAKTADAMHDYLEEKGSMGVLQYLKLDSEGIRYTRRYDGAEWSAVSPMAARSLTGPTRFWKSHAGSFGQILMPELCRIAQEGKARILVQPYLPVTETTHLPMLPPRSYVHNKFWRLEVDVDKERRGVWEFKPEIPVHCDTQLYLKFTVVTCDDGTPGAWVDQ